MDIVILKILLLLFLLTMSLLSGISDHCLIFHLAQVDSTLEKNISVGRDKIHDKMDENVKK